MKQESRARNFRSNTSIVLALSAFLIGVRLFYLGKAELIPEEAYYWQYARHLDFGYLDHPPMISWLIALGTKIFGHTEFGVRIGAFLLSLLTTFFIWLFAREIATPKVAAYAVLTSVCLPYFFLNGFFAFPDAPLACCSSIGIYLLYRAIFQGRRWGWYLWGVVIGIGMLSKYTIAIQVLSAVTFVAVVPKFRFWFRRPEPYLAGLLGLLFFSPVLYWNIIHDWASFAFQSTRRLDASTTFALHQYILNAKYLMTPLGVFAALVVWFGVSKHYQNGLAGDRLRFVYWLSAPHFFLFAIYSLRHEPKLNWAAPAFIPLIPYIAATIIGSFPEDGDFRLELNRFGSFLVRVNRILGLPILLISAGCFTFLLQYWSFGVPGISYSKGMRRFVGWPDLSQQIATICKEHEKITGHTPVVIGMEKHNVSSELAFYFAKEGEKFQVEGRSIFGLEALMYQWWSHSEEVEGRDLVLVGRSLEDVSEKRVSAFFDRISPVAEITTRKNGDAVGRYMIRIGENFHQKVETIP